MNSLKKMWGPAKLAILAQFEYRFNFFIDAVLQPLMVSGVEITFWYAVLSSAGGRLAGHSLSSYLAYALWGSFYSRIAVNWMYEYRMVDEINSGKVNSLIVRPFSFYQHYFSQFVGYKVATCIFSFLVPFVLSLFFFKETVLIARVPMAILLLLYYLIFVYTLSFAFACLALFFNKTHALTAAKNLIIALVSGEYFPLDLMPPRLLEVVLKLPFANGVFIPVGYLTGRHGTEMVMRGFMSTTYALIIVGICSYFLWTQGLKRYSGTGA